MSTNAPRQLRRAAADYVADDLDADERADFEQELAADDDLQQEVAFWERMGPALRQHGRPEARLPGPGMLAVVRRRAEEAAALEAATAPGRLGWTNFLGWGVAAAAILMLSITLLSQPDANPAVMAYTEDGSAVMLPPDNRPRPANRPVMVDFRTAENPAPATNVHRPWLGIWTDPIALRGFDRDRGLRVVRIAENGPAWQAGMRPGDVLLSLAECTMGTRYCIGRAVDQEHLRPGDVVGLRYWQHSTSEIIERQVTLGSWSEQDSVFSR